MIPTSAKPTTVPVLRHELTLKAASHEHDGSPAWIIHDPVINKFYRISWLDYEILKRWPLLHIAQIVTAVNAETTLRIDEEDVMALVTFLQTNQLIKVTSANQVDQLIAKKTASQQNKLSWLLKHYLFIRIPLIKPQRLLAAVLPLISWVFSQTMAWVLLFITLLGLFLVSRQWDTFSATLIDQLSLSGMVSFGIALIFSKCLHELGHAITATRYGVRVGHMGIALLVLFPMPYTDTSESWKLTNSRQRLHIAAAGIVVELALAGMATLLWSMSPEGSLKSALFFLATTSWVLTLLVNLSPFLRFDGYFILSDLLDFPNLHQRAGAFGKVYLRRFLLGFDDPWPETISSAKRKLLVAFASLTWLYRMLLFLGIATLVYYYFFKVLGIILFLVEIWWFILLPNLKEMKVWMMRKSEIKTSRLMLGGAMMCGLIALGFIPWQSHVEGAGWVHASKQHYIYTPTAGKLTNMHAAGKVSKGEKLFTLTSPDIALNAYRSQSMVKTRNAELRSLTGIEDGEEKRASLQNERDQFNAEMQLYQDELDRMVLIAPFDGQLTDINDNLNLNTWVSPKEALAIIIDPRTWTVDAFMPESEINRIHLGGKAKIYNLQNRLNIFEGIVTSIDANKIQKLPHPMLDANHGGPITTFLGSDRVPTQAFYKVSININNAESLNLQNMFLGLVKIETEAKALLPTLIERVAALFIRESGF